MRKQATDRVVYYPLAAIIVDEDGNHRRAIPSDIFEIAPSVTIKPIDEQTRRFAAGAFVGPDCEGPDGISFAGAEFMAVLVGDYMSVDVIFNQALKLVSSGRCYLQFGHGLVEGVTSVNRILARGNPNGGIYKLTEAGLTQLSDVYCKLHKTSHHSFEIYLSLYDRAMDASVHPHSRMLDMCVLLEAMILQGSNVELSYKFKLRYAKLRALKAGTDLKTEYDFAGEVYILRSNLAHSGTPKKSPVALAHLVDAVHWLIWLYLEEPKMFNNDVFEALCLGTYVKLEEGGS